MHESSWKIASSEAGNVSGSKHKNYVSHKKIETDIKQKHGRLAFSEFPEK